jgi:transcription antitermination factor NusG
MNAFGWYVIQSQPRKELFVRRHIEDFGREVFLPLLRERRFGRQQATVGPLFPSYLFAKLSEEAGDFPRIRWAQGVRRVLGDGGMARPLPDTVIETIRARSDPRGRVLLGASARKGRQVRIVDGPLAGLIGVLEQSATSREQRIHVLLTMFHRLTRIELPAGSVREVSVA